jgi:hypothetical protein
MVHTAEETLQVMGLLFLVMVGSVVLFALTNRASHNHKIAALPRTVLETIESKFSDVYRSRVETCCECGQFVYDPFVQRKGNPAIVRTSSGGTLLGSCKRRETSC